MSRKMEIEDDLYPFWISHKQTYLSEKVDVLHDVCFVESLLTKSRFWRGKNENVGKCLKVEESRFYKRPILSVLLGSLREANWPFRFRIQHLYRKVVGCVHAWSLRMLASVSARQLFESTDFIVLMNLHRSATISTAAQ